MKAPVFAVMLFVMLAPLGTLLTSWTNWHTQMESGGSRKLYAEASKTR